MSIANRWQPATGQATAIAFLESSQSNQ